MSVQIFTQANLYKLKWEKYYLGEQFRQYFSPIILDGVSNHIENLYGEVGLLAFEGYLLPFTLGNYKRKKTAYVASNISQYIDYAEDEIISNPKYKKQLRIIAPIVFEILRVFSRATGFDKCIFLNTFFLSTNLPQGKIPSGIEEAIKTLKKHYPNRAIVFKGIAANRSLPLLHRLKQSGFKTIPGRLLYFIAHDDEDFKKKRPYQQDLKRWQKAEGFTWVKPDKLLEEQRRTIVKFYKDLYLEKYSLFNPQYTERFIKAAHESKILPFDLLFKENELLAVQAIHTNQNELTTPFIGYDQKKPKDWNLYRFMNIRMTQLAIEKNLDFNMSSGAGKFKKQRGGKPIFEYNLVYLKGMAFYRKWPYLFFKWLFNKYVKPAMLKMDD